MSRGNVASLLKATKLCNNYVQYLYRIDHLAEEDKSSVDAVFLEVQPRDETVSKEAILGAYPPRGCGLSDLCHILRVRVTIVRLWTYRTIACIAYCSHPMKCISNTGSLIYSM